MHRYIIFFAVLIPLPVVAQEHVTLQERFRNEAPLAWSEYIHLASHVQGKMSSNTVNKTTGKTLWEGNQTIKINGAMALFTSEVVGKPPRVSCDNGQYNFIIDQTADTEWSIKQVLWNDRTSKTIDASVLASPGTETIGRLCWQRAMATSCRGMFISATWLPAMLSSPTFKIIEVRATSNEGREFIRVDFEYNPRDIRNNPVRNGYALLDPARYWLIEECSVQASWPRERAYGFIHTKNTFDDSIPGFPYVARQASGRIVLPNFAILESIHVSRLQKMDASDIEPFRLPAYGIPEPVERLRK